MKDLLIKINEATGRKDDRAKCALVSQMYEQMNAKLEQMGGDIAVAGLEVDIMAFNAELDKLEPICLALLNILNPELQKVLSFLKPRFEQNMHRHKDIKWEEVEQRLLEADPKKFWSLNEMEKTGGEPDITGIDKKTGELIFQDRSAESPTARRNCAFDKASEEKQKREIEDNFNKHPHGNAVDMAAQMGVELLDENEYREAQKNDELDQESSSWLKTPADKRKEGVALMGRREEVHEQTTNLNSPVWGWRGSLRI
jgi:hypothetical protein